jgi:hypothetical protein
MSKISTYTNAQSPISGSDKLIGTETGGIVENATKNFTVQELADFIGGGGSPITIENGNSLFSTGLTGTGASSIADASNFFGEDAGNGATDADNSNFFGLSAGNGATDADNSNFFGLSAGSGATDAAYSNFFGQNVGISATNAQFSNFFVANAGYGATNASYSNFFGLEAGSLALNANNSNFFGQSAGKNSSGNNVNAFGASAGLANTLSGQTIFSNASMPSFADHAAAAAAITVLLGASAGSTYLYHNQATDSIGAVRL